MNILLLTNCMKQPDDNDASTDVVFSFAKEWVVAGHRVVVVHNENKFPLILYKLPSFVYDKLKKKQNITIPSVGSRRMLERRQNGVDIVRFPIFKLLPHTAYLNRQYDDQKNKIVEYLKKLDFIPDVITGHWVEPQLRLVHDLGEFYHSKTGFVFHGDIPENFSPAYLKYLTELDCIFFRSRCTRDRMYINYPFLKNLKTSICYSGIPDEYLHLINNRCDWKENDIIRFVFVGRLVAYKRVDAIIDALVLAFPEGNFYLDVVGDGNELDNLIQQCREKGITDNIHFHGRIGRNEVQKVLQDADCFVMISENEVFGLVYLEAMAAGCITIASKNGGVDGIIQYGENGFLCNQGDSNHLKEIFRDINGMSTNDILRIRENGYRTVQRYTDAIVADNYLKCICEEEII